MIKTYKFFNLLLTISAVHNYSHTMLRLPTLANQLSTAQAATLASYVPGHTTASTTPQITIPKITLKKESLNTLAEEFFQDWQKQKIKNQSFHTPTNGMFKSTLPLLKEADTSRIQLEPFATITETCMSVCGLMIIGLVTMATIEYVKNTNDIQSILNEITPYLKDNTLVTNITINKAESLSRDHIHIIIKIEGPCVYNNSAHYDKVQSIIRDYISHRQGPELSISIEFSNPPLYPNNTESF